MVGNAMHRNLVERVLGFAPERAVLGRAGLSSVMANTKREEFLPFKRSKILSFYHQII